jgi:hypothetical protein
LGLRDELFDQRTESLAGGGHLRLVVQAHRDHLEEREVLELQLDRALEQELESGERVVLLFVAAVGRRLGNSATSSILKPAQSCGKS